MNKRGQVTLFIIVALVIVGFVIIYFALFEGLIFGKYPPEVQNVYSFIQICIEDVGEEVIYEIAKGGGYYFSPNISTETGVPYYSFNGENYMPTKEEIEEEISFWIDQKLFFCTRNFVDFPNFKITQGEINTKTNIEENKIILNVKYPIRVSKEEDTFLFEDFKNIEIPVRMGLVYDSILEFQRDSSESICLSCMLDISLRNDLYIDMNDYDERTVLFTWIDERSKLNDEQLMWFYVNKY